jgi:hypothetical protein
MEAVSQQVNCKTSVGELESREELLLRRLSNYSPLFRK